MKPRLDDLQTLVKMNQEVSPIYQAIYNFDKASIPFGAGDGI